MAIDNTYHSDLAIPPGEYLEEVLDELGMTKNELAKRMGRPATKLSAIFKGHKEITPETALQLETVVGVPAHIWTGLEKEYRLTLARSDALAESEKIDDEIPMARKFPYSDLAKRGLVRQTQVQKERVLEVRRFFGVTSLRHIEYINNYQPAFRFGATSGKSEPSSPALAAWLRAGELIAQRLECQPYDKQNLEGITRKFNLLTITTPEISIRSLRKALCDVGVALVICDHFPKTYANGATFWLGSSKAVVLVSRRGKRADIFWFTVLHELAHIILHRKNAVFVEFDNHRYEREDLEEQADEFAENTLIPRDQYEAFVRQDSFYENDVRKFAKLVKVHPGIVVGRLQKDGHLHHSWQNDLRQPLDLTDIS